MTSQKTKQGKALQSSLNFSSDNFLQLDSNLVFPEPRLNNVIEDSSHTLRIISLAQAVAETDKDHQSRNENPNPIDVPLVTQS